jgi:hypothetical protein
VPIDHSLVTSVLSLVVYSTSGISKLRTPKFDTASMAEHDDDDSNRHHKLSRVATECANHSLRTTLILTPELTSFLLNFLTVKDATNYWQTRTPAPDESELYRRLLHVRYVRLYLSYTPYISCTLKSNDSMLRSSRILWIFWYLHAMLTRSTQLRAATSTAPDKVSIALKIDPYASDDAPTSDSESNDATRTFTVGAIVKTSNRILLTYTYILGHANTAHCISKFQSNRVVDGVLSSLWEWDFRTCRGDIIKSNSDDVDRDVGMLLATHRRGTLSVFTHNTDTDVLAYSILQDTFLDIEHAHVKRDANDVASPSRNRMYETVSVQVTLSSEQLTPAYSPSVSDSDAVQAYTPSSGTYSSSPTPV